MELVRSIGVLRILLGGAGFVFGSVTVPKEHEANAFGAELSVTTEEKRRIPPLLSGGVVAVGVLLTIIAALKMEQR